MEESCHAALPGTCLAIIYTNPFQWAKVNLLTTQNQGLPRIARLANLVKKWGHTQVYANVDRESMGK